MEKKMKKNICICITESLCCTAETNTTLHINYILQLKKNNNNFQNIKENSEKDVIVLHFCKSFSSLVS